MLSYRDELNHNNNYYNFQKIFFENSSKNNCP